ncbi:hypothetical protein [Burkholderia multivorans]|uniref:hypothetical protein n=1 Tax=Burkholderia multivorans TaxID=87883 RepID=UPI001C22D700|nr:hypothetical protein [Burkholderia multivorans]MBU9210089.1 hypothetical protein [Burkholderia multivorans]MCO1460195.1 hypothetical protein [Burkholderia multivorans]UQN69687.1 hypothetical protein L0Z45_01900 [Burkholderia multivorans]UQN75414.1 hypothetical protein L0Z11_01875 [Burkholderia multivorans]
MKLPFRQLDVGEWFERTLLLNGEEMGVLIFLENLYWRTGELPSGDDLEAHRVARNVTPQVWAKILRLYFPDGRAAHLDHERERAIAKSESGKANGAKGGRPRKASPESGEGQVQEF